MRTLSLLLCLLLTAGLCGCAPQRVPEAPPAAPPVSAPPQPEAPTPAEAEAPLPATGAEETAPTGAASPETAGPVAEPFPGTIPLSNDYIAAVADGVLREIIDPEADDYTKIRTVYRWLVESTAFFEDRPVGLEVWQWRGDICQVPDYEENRALSVLLFGIGSCEDYAGAAVVLLRRLGLPAEYVAGLTVSVRGGFVPHAWAVVQLEGRWYHLDPQLEDNVTRRDRLTYRFFLKGDEAMLADHRWGENLIAYYGAEMTPERAANIRESWPVPPCPASLRPPEPERIVQAPVPDRGRVAEAIAAERRAWEAEHGPLPPVEMKVAPPEL